MRDRLWGAVAVLSVLVTGCGGSQDTDGDTVAPGGSAVPSSTVLTQDSVLTAPGPGDEPGVLAGFFDAVTVRVSGADGETSGPCLWAADSETERARGLMQVEDLEGADGMVFVYDRPTSSAFWMKDTLIPLSIAYFDTDGVFVGAQDMEPCPPGTDCPVYPPPGEFVLAVEVPQGGLTDLGLVSGSRIELGEACVVGQS
jgi:uncharacterized membrane protein (UPF0127 family)